MKQIIEVLIKKFEHILNIIGRYFNSVYKNVLFYKQLFAYSAIRNMNFIFSLILAYDNSLLELYM